jgi:YVTN family beta-propeller protein
MQPSVASQWLRAAFFAVAVVLFLVCGIGIAGALTADRHARPAAVKDSAAEKAAAADKAPARDRAKAPLGAARSRARLLGVVAPLGGRQRGAAVRSSASRPGLAGRPLARLLSVARHSRKAQVMVSALGDPKVVVGSQPTGVAVAATRAYVANQGSGSVSVIDLTLSPPVVVATVAVGGQPDALALSANGARVYAANFGSGTVSVIDSATNAVAKTVTVGSRPTGLVEVGGLVYVANLGSQSVSVFDPALAVPVVSSFAVPATGVVERAERAGGLGERPAVVRERRAEREDLRLRPDPESAAVDRERAERPGQLPGLFGGPGDDGFFGESGDEQRPGVGSGRVDGDERAGRDESLWCACVAFVGGGVRGQFRF